jgi:hypothetical protein
VEGRARRTHAACGFALTPIESLLSRLAADPAAYLHSLDLDGQRALLLAVDRGFYRDATFLDERVFNSRWPGVWVPLGLAWQALEAAPRAPLGFIFHLGRSGSTLLSRLLDEVPGVLGLREPLALRPLALDSSAPPQALRLVHAALARRFPGDRAVLVKATSICNAIAPALLAQHADDRAVALTVGLRAQLANALDKAPGDDQLAFAAQRGALLRARVAGFALDLGAQSPARLAALSWLAEMVALAPLRSEPRARFIDFDSLLTAREPTLSGVLGHLGLPVDAAAPLAASPAFERYSKRTDLRFDAAARREVLVRSWRANRAAILDAEALVASLAERHPELRGILEAATASAAPQDWPTA